MNSPAHLVALCQIFVFPLPDGADLVVLDAVELVTFSGGSSKSIAGVGWRRVCSLVRGPALAFPSVATIDAMAVAHALACAAGDAGPDPGLPVDQCRLLGRARCREARHYRWRLQRVNQSPALTGGVCTALCAGLHYRFHRWPYVHAVVVATPLTYAPSGVGPIPVFLSLDIAALGVLDAVERVSAGESSSGSFSGRRGQAAYLRPCARLALSLSSAAAHDAVAVVHSSVRALDDTGPIFATILDDVASLVVFDVVALAFAASGPKWIDQQLATAI